MGDVTKSKNPMPAGLYMDCGHPINYTFNIVHQRSLVETTFFVFVKGLSAKILYLFTGQAGQDDMYEATRLGAYSCLLKPVAPEKLMSLLQQLPARK